MHSKLVEQNYLVKQQLKNQIFPNPIFSTTLYHNPIEITCLTFPTGEGLNYGTMISADYPSEVFRFSSIFCG